MGKNHKEQMYHCRKTLRAKVKKEMNAIMAIYVYSDKKYAVELLI